MKTLKAILLLSVLHIPVYGATITFSNTNTAFSSFLPVVSSTGAVITNGSGNIAIGFFGDETGVASGDFTSFVQFGSSVIFGQGDAFGLDSIYSGETSQTITAGSPFVGENIFTFLTFGGDALVAKSSIFFTEDAPLFTAGIDIANDSGISYLFGGSAGPSVDIGSGPVPSISMAAVPEPSSFALIAGCFGLALAVVRRRSR